MEENCTLYPSFILRALCEEHLDRESMYGLCRSEFFILFSLNLNNIITLIRMQGIHMHLALSRMLTKLLTSCSQPFGYFLVTGFVAAAVLVLVLTASMVMENPEVLHAEGGILELLSLLCWIGAVLVSISMLFRRTSRQERALFGWLALLCALAGARELDAQVLLNPRYIGSIGVHYRIDWFLSPKVNTYLKRVWGAIFLAAGFVIFGPLVMKRKEIRRLIVTGDNAMGLFLVGFLFLIGGYIIDDILREQLKSIALNLRRGMEESSETVGAILFLIGVCLLAYRQLSERIHGN